MKVTEVERKESTKHCCGNGCLWRDSAEHEEETEALIDKRIAQNNTTDADRQARGLLEEIVSRGNLNRAYKRVLQAGEEEQRGRRSRWDESG